MNETNKFINQHSGWAGARGMNYAYILCISYISIYVPTFGTREEGRRIHTQIAVLVITI